MNAVNQELVWVKSSYSDTEGGQCVEVAATSAAVHIRDSKSMSGPLVSVSPGAWAPFVELASRQQV